MKHKDDLLLIYRDYVVRTGARAASIEQVLSSPSPLAALGEDDRRNISVAFQSVFSRESRSFIEKLYTDAMAKMRGQARSASDDSLDGLAFLQEVVATAMWKYRCDVGDELATFARDFDRLDVPSERDRLYARAQSSV